MAKKINWNQLAFDRAQISKAGIYNVWEEYPWHWVVSKKGSNVKVHVWPTVRKYMAYFDMGASHYKNDLAECLNRCFSPPNLTLTQEQIDAYKDMKKAKELFE